MPRDPKMHGCPHRLHPQALLQLLAHQAEMIEAVLPAGKVGWGFNSVPTIYLEKSRWVHSHALTIHESYDIQLSLVLTE